MWSASFWRGVLDRALKSAAQAVLVWWGALGFAVPADAGQVLPELVYPALAWAAVGAVSSLLFSLASAPVGDRGSTSAVPGAT